MSYHLVSLYEIERRRWYRNVLWIAKAQGRSPDSRRTRCDRASGHRPDVLRRQKCQSSWTQSFDRFSFDRGSFLRWRWVAGSRRRSFWPTERGRREEEQLRRGAVCNPGNCRCQIFRLKWRIWLIVCLRFEIFKNRFILKKMIIERFRLSWDYVLRVELVTESIFGLFV